MLHFATLCQLRKYIRSIKKLFDISLVPIERYHGTNFVTGLRGLSAMMVFAIHSGGAGLRDLGTIGDLLADLGRTGVYVFFVISGFSLASSLERSLTKRRFLLRRFLRVIPLYFLWITAVFLISNRREYGELLWHITFLSFLVPEVTNSVLGVEWSIPVEMFWYLLFPSLVSMTVKFGYLWSISIALGISVTSHFLIAGLGSSVHALWWHYSPFPYAISFLLGQYAFKLRRTNSRDGVHGTLVAGSLLVVLLQNWISVGLIPEYLLISYIAFSSLVVLRDDHGLVGRLMCSRPLITVGVLSYGVYLSHMPCILIVQMIFGPISAPVVFVLAGALTIAVSIITFWCIEYPIRHLAKTR